MRTRIGILGCGPAGLFLAHLLARLGIDCVILEQRGRAEVEGTIRAGVLEHWVVELMAELGLDARLQREAHRHDGITLQWEGRRLHLDLAGLTGGRRVTVYAQHELLKDLIAARLAQGEPILFGVRGAHPVEVESDRPAILFEQDGVARRLECDFILGADGFHGPSRQAIPAARRQEFHRHWPFGWLGILAEAPLSWHELIYANQAGGFALLSTRSPEIQRMYLQCDPADALALWPDDRIWETLEARLAAGDGWRLRRGRIFQKSIIPLRSFVCQTMRHGRLFLAGDAAHIVPPTGAKGLNLAVADVRVLARALEAWYRRSDARGIETYAETCLRRVWKGQRFSWMMTSMLHQESGQDPFEQQLHRAGLELLASSRPAAAALAENYVGLPFED